MPEQLHKPLADWLLEERGPFDARFDSAHGDGMILPWIRAFFGLSYWHFLHDCFVRWLLRNQLANDMSYAHATAQCRRARDMYAAFALFLMSVFYVMIYLALKADCLGTLICLAVAVPFVFFRLIEISSVMVALHLSRIGYASDSPTRAVILTVMNYCEITIAFAVFFSIESYCCRDPFKGLLDSIVNPLYFSVLTIATVGYGDFVPEKDAGKVLVVIEVIVGLLLLVVIFQRTVAISLVANIGKNGDQGVMTSEAEMADRTNKDPIKAPETPSGGVR